ncbi:MAG: GGDEF domain-containing protein, partial [Rhizobiaceae bacterium]
MRGSNLRLLSVAWPFILIILVQTALATFSLQVTSSLRAYVSGESLWSKGQRDAIYFLHSYLDNGEPEQLARYRAAIAIPLGDRDARLALEADPPDLAAAAAGYLQGGNHPDDIPGLTWLYRYFSWLPDMQNSIQDWRVADVGML